MPFANLTPMGVLKQASTVWLPDVTKASEATRAQYYPLCIDDRNVYRSAPDQKRWSRGHVLAWSVPDCNRGLQFKTAGVVSQNGIVRIDKAGGHLEGPAASQISNRSDE